MRISIKQLKKLISEAFHEEDPAGLKLGRKSPPQRLQQKVRPSLNAKSSDSDSWNDSLDTDDDRSGLKKTTEDCGCSHMDEVDNLKPTDSRRRPQKIMQPGEVDFEDTFSNRGLKHKPPGLDFYDDPVSTKPVDRLSLDNDLPRRTKLGMKESEEDPKESEDLDEAELDEMGPRGGFDFADCVRQLRGQSDNPEEDCRKKQKRSMGTSRGR